MHNSHFNLLNQLVQEQKSLWRIEEHYITDSTNKDEQKFWKSLAAKKKKIVSELQALIKKTK